MRSVRRIPWKSHPCPRGCGAQWNWYVYMSRSGPLVSTPWWNGDTNREFTWSPNENKPAQEVRVIEHEGKTREARFSVHPTSPGWKPGGKHVRRIKRCC